jgi:glycine cleavage system H protein
MKWYTKDHEWIEIVKGVGTLGISKYAAEELGDITYVELPDVGAVMGAGDVLCVVESVKAASDVFLPVGGEILEVNEKLNATPELINTAAEGAGWICRIGDLLPVDEAELLTEAQYEEFLAEQE